MKTVYTSTYPADTTNFQTIASRLADKKPDLIAQGAVFEDGVGLVRSLKPELLPEDAVPDLGAQQRLAVQRRHRQGQHRGRLLHGEPGTRTPRRRTTPSSWPPTRPPTRTPTRPRTPPTRTPPPRCWPPRRRPWARSTRRRSASGCTPTRSARSSGRSPGSRPASRRATSCSRSGSRARCRWWLPRRLPPPTRP
nr:hypothetical protein [Angustibacter aerolatus]